VSDDAVNFRSSAEGLVHAFRARISAECIRQLELAGLEVDQKLKTKYPRQAMDAWIRILAADLYPSLSFDDACVRLGEDFLDGWAQTLAGRALTAVLRVLGPAKAIEKSAAGFRAGDNYTTVEIVALADNAFQLTFAEVGETPRFKCGILQAAARQAGAEQPRAELTEYDGHRAVYRISWRG
jgi:uncharacterized protein (TIGR02265 family)